MERRRIWSESRRERLVAQAFAGLTEGLNAKEWEALLQWRSGLVNLHVYNFASLSTEPLKADYVPWMCVCCPG